MKPRKESVSLVITDDSGKFLVVQRANDPEDDLAGVWGFPAVSLKEGEDQATAAARVGRQKLGVEIALGEKIGGSTHDRSTYTLHLTDYKATIVQGQPHVPQPDAGVSQYAACKFTSDPTILFEAARKDSQCTQIFLESIGADWQTV